MSSSSREPVIVGAVRTPVGKRGGALAAWHPADLLGHTLSELVARTGIDPARIDDVIAGSIMTHDQSANIGRHAVLSAGLPESVPAVTVDRQCGSAQQAVTFAAHGVAAGSYDLVIACGVESMSQMPLPASLRPGAPLGPHYSPRELARYNGELMVQGPSSELMNTRFDLTREELDEFSRRSHVRAYAATRDGRFRKQMVSMVRDPFDDTSEPVTEDEGIRAELDPDKMSHLTPVFAEGGRTTAANSSQLSDGAAALLIAERSFAEANGLTPRARFVIHSVAASDPVIQFTAILDSTRKALDRSGMNVDDIDLFEVNEAFAGVPLMFQREFNIPDDKLNVNGGSIAIGHPLGSTGARMLTDLLCELERSGKRYGLQTICEAHGTANTTIIEKL
ncbi:thiolase family protein [Nocardia donostiensis]|uniref:Acetyl-CoA acetyltransferase n=1 Tax=Nocardia donostiensis TaxID=1538463 RepID=A0A1W0B7D4_9NOCA|nr:thiolase family protein [Nocardia donostiensis]ONM46252.1 acetyl-CoA acetyltransferase [Nocardia donostiensis]OQS12456.1 acetyl-CoA acetyltransferase [Nocardia donostiensis]OQS18423.1 acetyl-CoA acetyltransferase [Nocardia donostiensis]